MGSITKKYALKVARLAQKYLSEPTDARSIERRRKKRKFSKYLTITIASLTAIIYLVAIFYALIYHPAVASGSQPKKAASLTISPLQMSSGSKVTILQSSAAAALTVYPDKSQNALSSSIVDQKTGNQTYIHTVGKGALPYACVDLHLLGIPIYKKCPDLKYDATDILTGNPNGAMFGFPTGYTTSNKMVTDLLTAAQVIAFACLTPIIMMIGLNLMLKGIAARFASAVESLPRLLLVVVGVGSCLLLAQLLLGFANQATVEFMNAAGVGNASTAIGGYSMADLIVPAKNWSDILTMFFWLCVGMLIAQAAAPSAILGNVFGAVLSINFIIEITKNMIANTEVLFLTILSMSLLGQVFTRIVLIDFYVILSPLAIVVAGLPGSSGSKFARDWIMGLGGLVMSQFGQVAVLIVGLEILSAYQTNNTTGPDIIIPLLKYGTLMLMMRVPTLFKSSAANLVTQVGSSVAGSVAHQKMILM